MSDIRVTYSGLISFGVGISTIFTSLVFTLIVTRQLTPGEFGTWSLIGALIGYVLVVEPIISEWVIRETARGEKSGKTAIVSTGFFSIAAIGIYIIIAFFVGGQSDAEYEILFFAGMLIPPMFLSQILTTINYGWKPHRASYGNFVLQFSKIPVALIFVYFLDTFRNSSASVRTRHRLRKSNRLKTWLLGQGFRSCVDHFVPDGGVISP